MNDKNHFALVEKSQNIPLDSNIIHLTHSLV